MASDEDQFYQLLDCLMSLDNNTRQQAEVGYCDTYTELLLQSIGNTN